MNNQGLWEGGVKYKEWREIFQSTEETSSTYPHHVSVVWKDFGSFMKELLQQLRHFAQRTNVDF